jgi:hypothetical protein
LTFQAGLKVVEIYKKENKAIKDKLKKLNTMGDKSLSKSMSKKSKSGTSEKLGLADRKKDGDKV